MLRLENIHVELDAFRLKDIDLHIRRGEYRVVLGSTGTGKTVLLETVAGMHQPCNGRILLRNRDITGLEPEKRNLGIVYQDYALFPHMSVRENISFGLKIRGMPKKKIEEDVMQIADFLRLRHIIDRNPCYLSGGERQRTALARALVMKPWMLLLDEPLSALDMLTRKRLKSELKRIHRNLGLTVLHITHDLSEAFLLADTLTVMKDGRILQEGSPEELLARPSCGAAAELLGISNFIPAHVDQGIIHMHGLGSVPSELFSPAPDVRHILLTVPEWAVELSSMAGTGACLWEGDAAVKNIDVNGGHIVANLELPGGTELGVAFSRREIARFLSFPEPGALVPCRIGTAGVHWVPAEDHERI